MTGTTSGTPVRWEDHPGQHAACDAAIAGLRVRAEAAEARLLELEGAITWNTSCTSCARVLDSAYAETVRREKAEARLAVLELHLPAVLRALEAAATGAGYEAIARPYRDARDALSAGEEAGQ